MGRRGKVVLARILNERKRRETLRKRRAGLFKKMSELTTLCGAEGAVVIYSFGDKEPSVWPSEAEARATISKYFSRPEVERKSRAHTAVSFIEEKCKRKKNKAERMIKKNDERCLQALTTLIYDGKIMIQDLDSVHKEKLSEFADKRKKELQKHIRKLNRRQHKASLQPQPQPLLQTPPEAQGGLTIDGFAEAGSHGQLENVRAKKILGRTGGVASSLNISAILGRKLSNPASSHGQEMIRRGNRLDRSRLSGQTNLGGVSQHPLPSPLYMPPTAPFSTPIQSSYRPQAPPHVLQLPQVSEPPSGLDIYALTVGRNMSSPAATTEGHPINIRGMRRLAPPPLQLSLLNPNLFIMSPNNLAEDGLDMTRRFYGHTNNGGMMQYPLPSHSPMRPTMPLAMSNVQSMASSPGHGNFGEMIHQASPPSLPIELPRRLGLPPMALMQYDASGMDKFINEDGWNTNNFTTGTNSLDQNNFGEEYTWNTNEFPEPANASLNQGNVTSNGIWDDFDTAPNFNIEPHWWR